jgi:quinol-cytochrome oxidoreductase complex cytochrome b subunit
MDHGKTDVTTQQQATPARPGLWQGLVRWRASSTPTASTGWWFSLGAAPLQLFAVQVITGLLLALHYRASAADAYGSTQFITEQLSYGWFVRGLHRWSATLMIASALLHQIRVLVAGAYREPRQWTWLSGWSCLLVAVAASFTGEFLTGQQRGVWSIVLGANLVAEVPGVGPVLRRLLVGGDGLVEGSFARLFAAHAVLVPALVVALMAAHLLLVRHFGSTASGSDTTASAPRRIAFGPDQLRLDLLVGLGLVLTATVLATADPGALGPAATLHGNVDSIRPHWYALSAVRWVRLVPA